MGVKESENLACFVGVFCLMRHVVGRLFIAGGFMIFGCSRRKGPEKSREMSQQLNREIKPVKLLEYCICHTFHKLWDLISTSAINPVTFCVF